MNVAGDDQFIVKVPNTSGHLGLEIGARFRSAGKMMIAGHLISRNQFDYANSQDGSLPDERVVRLTQKSGVTLKTHEQPKGVDIMSGLTKKIIAIAGASAFVSGAAMAADLTVVSWGGAYTKVTGRGLS